MKNWSKLAKLIAVIVLLIVANVVAQYLHGYLDLTEEKRFTLTESTREVVDNVDGPMDIQILLTGDFPAGFERLEQATADILDDFSDMNADIEYSFYDLTNGSPQEKQKRAEALAKQGIVPTNLKHFDGKEYIQKAIYPYAIITYKGRKTAVNLLEEQSSAYSEDEILNKSVELLEYKFANAINKISQANPKRIAFLSGHGELPLRNTVALQSELARYYAMTRIDLDTIRNIENVDLLVVAGPQTAYSDADKLKIDQFVMNGGRMLWMLEKFNVTLDSIGRKDVYVPTTRELNIDDLLFKYGIRIQPNLVMDLESSKIPQIVGQQGGKLQTQLFPWVYHPMTTPHRNHLITKNIDRVNMLFPSSIDTVKTKSSIRKTALLTSSDYSRFQLSPMRLTFEILKFEPDPKMFNKGKLPLAVLLEGKFTSLYQNRYTNTLQQQLGNKKYLPESQETKMIVISDSDFASNSIDPKTGRPQPLGYNKWDRQIYAGNRAFILNAIEYLLDDTGVLESRAKEVKLRLLDKVKTKEDARKWQVINIVIPIAIVVLFGLIFNFLRRRRYT